MYKRQTIYNSIANCLINNLDELSDACINVFRLDFTHESQELISKITKAFINTVNNDFYVDIDDQEIFDNIETTLGHLYKGVE